MPKTRVVFFKDTDGSIPTKIWMDEVVAKRDRRVLVKLRAVVNVLRCEGRSLRRPVCDVLRNGIYELRVRFGSVNYRLLYFFIGDTAAVVSHGCLKESKVPPKEIDLASARKKLYESDPERYTYDGEI